MSSKKPITFKNSNGLQLVGILHEPPAGAIRRDEAVVLLSPGIKNRVAPHRLYVKMAERFVDLGYPVFRFDPEGIGDSEGEIVENLTADVLGSVEFGRFVASTVDALNWLEKELGLSKFIVGGLCGGAITGLLAAAQDGRITGLLGLGIPAISSAITVSDPYRYISRGQLQGLKQGYFRNLLSPQRWWRLLTLQSDYRMIGKVLLSMVRKGKQTGAAAPDQTAATPEQSNLSPLFVDAIFKLLTSGRQMCLIFSEVDRLYWDFQEKFFTVYREKCEAYREHYEIHVVANANHIFSFPEWEAEMMEKAGAWLDRRDRS
ncbi:hypothetical protein KQH41_00220 [bacterium]|nr:hypothetical protein [bacterium]